MGGLGATTDAGLAVPEGGGTTPVPARLGLPHLCQPDRGCDDQGALLLSHFLGRKKGGKAFQICPADLECICSHGEWVWPPAHVLRKLVV